MAGCFEQINNREDFRREVDRARVLCAKLLKQSAKDPTILSVDMQLKFIQDRLKAGKAFTRKERKSINMGYKAHREFEETRNVELWEFKELIMLLDLYMEYWPTDRLASDPKNEDKMDWLMEL
jgi:hypothetical protein